VQNHPKGKKVTDNINLLWGETDRWLSGMIYTDSIIYLKEAFRLRKLSGYTEVLHSTSSGGESPHHWQPKWTKWMNHCGNQTHSAFTQSTPHIPITLMGFSGYLCKGQSIRSTTTVVELVRSELFSTLFCDSQSQGKPGIRRNQDQTISDNTSLYILTSCLALKATQLLLTPDSGWRRWFFVTNMNMPPCGPRKLLW